MKKYILPFVSLSLIVNFPGGIKASFEKDAPGSGVQRTRAFSENRVEDYVYCSLKGNGDFQAGVKLAAAEDRMAGGFRGAYQAKVQGEYQAMMTSLTEEIDDRKLHPLYRGRDTSAAYKAYMRWLILQANKAQPVQ